ncbi:MAG: 23S rRNA (uracil(1939)-C(5))-methyltransferase RlmD [Ruminococcaceae bacterium]|nr:23S rRNA (uracil(1939)-C(5))-methyltransferase RlmD [Oscillospiraceae bacterium]
MQKNEIYEVSITDINNLGNGICRIGDMVTFVPGAVTGDTLSVKIIKVAKSYAVARIEEILDPSEHRISSDCPVHVRCGGCVYRHISYDFEREIKKNYVKTVFRKEGMPQTAVLDTVSDGKVNAYRNKAQYPVSADYKAGFYAAKSHEVVPCGNCMLQPDFFGSICSDICDFLKRKNVDIYREMTADGTLRHIYIRYAKGTGDTMVCLVLFKKKFNCKEEFIKLLTDKYPHIKTIVLNYNTDVTNVIMGKEQEIIYGDGYIEDVLCGMHYRISALAFYQVNHDMAEVLYEKVYELAEATPDDKIVDLYCGVGTIGLYVAKKSGAKSLVGVEIIPEAIENAKVNAKLSGVENADFICADADHPAVKDADIVILDPPRKGCSDELIKRLISIAPKKIVYVSCDCATLARDAHKLVDSGYIMSEVCPIDLFPRTGHVESITRFVRNDAI